MTTNKKLDSIKLKQERLLETRTISIRNDHVEVKVKSRNLEESREFPFLDIGATSSFRTVKPQPNYAMHVITRNLAIVFLFCGIFGAFDTAWTWFFVCLASTTTFFVIHAYTSNRFRTIQSFNNQEFEIFSDEPSEDAVDEFVEIIYEKRNKFVLDEFHRKGLAGDERIQWLQWMKDQKMVTDTEFARLTESQSQDSDELH